MFSNGAVKMDVNVIAQCMLKLTHMDICNVIQWYHQNGYPWDASTGTNADF
jgi:hypothetical protein